jgi:ribosomal protein S18 acetylase RimI-like enzyme
MRSPHDRLNSGYFVRILAGADVAAFISLRSRGLRLYPEAFGQSVEEFESTPREVVATRFVSGGEEHGFVLGAFEEKDHKLVGVVGMRRLEGQKSRHRGYVWGMFVEPEAQGRGLGRALLTECLERARKIKGLENLELSVLVDNSHALQLYRSVGFKIYGTHPRALKIDGRAFEEHLLCLSLSSPLL